MLVVMEEHLNALYDETVELNRSARVLLSLPSSLQSTLMPTCQILGGS